MGSHAAGKLQLLPVHGSLRPWVEAAMFSTSPASFCRSSGSAEEPGEGFVGVGKDVGGEAGVGGDCDADAIGLDQLHRRGDGESHEAAGDAGPFADEVIARGECGRLHARDGSEVCQQPAHACGPRLRPAPG